jgi:sortase A
LDRLFGISEIVVEACERLTQVACADVTPAALPIGARKRSVHQIAFPDDEEGEVGRALENALRKRQFTAMKFLKILGKTLISMGVGVLMFVAWTLWGTGIYTAQQQDRLSEEFDLSPDLIPVRVADRDESGRRVVYSGPPKRFEPGPGEAVYQISIPSIDLDQTVVHGVDVEQLRKGPGHYPSCGEGFDLCTEDIDEIWPGERGRVIVSGHRTTYGAPFWDLDKLERGDQVRVQTKWGGFVYRVIEKQIVDADFVGIVIPGDDAELVLTTCNPKFSAAQRLVVYSEIEKERV